MTKDEWETCGSGEELLNYTLSAGVSREKIGKAACKCVGLSLHIPTRKWASRIAYFLRKAWEPDAKLKAGIDTLQSWAEGPNLAPSIATHVAVTFVTDANHRWPGLAAKWSAIALRENGAEEEVAMRATADAVRSVISWEDTKLTAE